MGERRVCRGRDCDVDLTGTRGKRIWCSQRCRRRTQYTAICRECSADVYDGTATPDDLCGDCKHEAKYGERNRQIKEKWREGLPARLIAEEIGEGLSSHSVTSLVHAWRKRGETNLPLRRLGGDADVREERRQQIIAWRSEGLTNHQIASRLGTSAASVNGMFDRAERLGLEVPPNPVDPQGAAAPIASPQYLEELWSEGLTLEQIAEFTGYASISSVYSRIKRLRQAGHHFPARRRGRKRVAA